MTCFTAEGHGEERGKELRYRIHNYRDSRCFIIGNHSSKNDDWIVTTRLL